MFDPPALRTVKLWLTALLSTRTTRSSLLTLSASDGAWVATRNESRLKPGVVTTSLSSCTPAPSATVLMGISCQVEDRPVAFTTTVSLLTTPVLLE